MKIQKAEIWEDGLRTDPNKKSYEWWYFDANLDDKSTIVITFFTKPAQNASGPLKPQIQIVYTDPEGKMHTFTKTYDPSEFSASKEKCDIKMGSNSVFGDLKKYSLKFGLEEISGELEFDRIAPSYSTTQDKDAKPLPMGWFPAIPYGKVSGVIHFSGQVLKVKGTGYHDHNWGVIDMKSICDYWYWGRGTAGGYSIIFSIVYLPKILGKPNGSIFYLAKGDQLLVGQSDQLVLTETNIKPARPTAKHLPTKLRFTFTDADAKVEFTLSNPKMIDSVNPFSSEPKWKQLITSLFSKPRYVRYNADLEVEILIDGKKETVSGKSLYEIMILR